MSDNISSEKFFYKPALKKTDAINLWFCFPAEYNIGMSSLGYLNLFKILDLTDFVHAERIFTDTNKTKIFPSEVDLISFSFSFEFDFLNVFRILEKYNIEVFSHNRDENSPLIMGGGSVLTANPEPFYNIFDFVMTGDGDELILEISHILYENKYLSKSEKLKLLAQIEGCYVPSLQSFSDIQRKICHLSACVHSPIVTENTAFSDTFLIELIRGCPFKCNFCLTSHINNPLHCPDIQSVKTAINTGLSKCSALGLLGALVPANPNFEELCEYLIYLRKHQEFKVSIGSLRADFITPLNIKMLTICGQKTATIAIEAGSQKMRDFINKKLTEEQILKAVETAYSNGLEGLKLYAMTGFSNETDEDIEELITLAKKIKQNKKLILAVNSFVPKKQTPFEKFSYENPKVLEKKFKFLKKECHKAGIAFRPSSIAWNELQAVISTGGRELAPLLYEIYKSGSTIGTFKKIFRKNNILI